ncbi:hypothetical protein [Chelativorans sp. AA-79]|uniref:hypothetical protein n=1 Tax=Chelativorans sp. AA-79 TaxID=3028735 RepID=UPI0023F7DE27|nr:hypothetical protein [Chelativorans sp. AA-79]WEX08252.1 hypothetical protein PVE73_19545 [Chelativorans sp. AA-79]
MDTFVVAVMYMESGQVNCFPADYLNDFPLWDDPPDLLKTGDRSRFLAKVQGCNATGWFDHLPDERNGAIISPMHLGEGQRLIGWCPIDDLIPGKEQIGPLP